MKPLPLVDSVRLPEGRAVQRHFDDLNWRVLRWLLAGFLPGALIGAIATLDEGIYALGAAWGVNFLVVLAMVLMRRTRVFERHFRELTIGYLLVQFAVLLVVGHEVGFKYALAGFIVPLQLVFLRLRRVELAGLVGVSLAVALWISINPGADASPPWETQLGMGLGALVGCAASFFVASRLAAKTERTFLADWRPEHGRSRERRRMREELADARQIQLSMLPRAAPNLAWLELASASLPASEVGGDYFDYVPLDRERLAIVVGDVAGHGMASGLVLAAIRGGLHLLRDELSSPLTALRRLDRMVGEIAPGRMYVTLQIAVLDHAERRLTVVSAGHPPVLHYRLTTATVEEIGGPAIPLGTRLESRLTEHAVELAAGDVLLFYSDGALEAADEHGDLFGEGRLADTLRRSAPGRSAAEVRASLLETVNRFKGDAELADDLTVVVAKVSG